MILKSFGNSGIKGENGRATRDFKWRACPNLDIGLKVAIVGLATIQRTTIESPIPCSLFSIIQICREFGGLQNSTWRRDLGCSINGKGDLGLSITPIPSNKNPHPCRPLPPPILVIHLAFQKNCLACLVASTMSSHGVVLVISSSSMAIITLGDVFCTFEATSSIGLCSTLSLS